MELKVPIEEEKKVENEKVEKKENVFGGNKEGGGSSLARDFEVEHPTVLTKMWRRITFIKYVLYLTVMEVLQELLRLFS